MRELFPTTLKCVFQIRHSPSLFIFERFILVTNSLVNTIALLCSQSVYSPFKNKKKEETQRGQAIYPRPHSQTVFEKEQNLKVLPPNPKCSSLGHATSF